MTDTLTRQEAHARHVQILADAAHEVVESHREVGEGWDYTLPEKYLDEPVRHDGRRDDPWLR